MNVPPALTMTWRDLLFAHWPVPVEALRTHVPRGLEIDEFDGTAWLGIVPFGMTQVRPLGIWLPGEQFRFAEVNVRTYVTGGGHRGVWFLSLDGGHAPAAAAARLAFGINYRHARVRLTNHDEWFYFESARVGSTTDGAFRARYRPIGPGRIAAPGTLPEFLTNRLSLFGIDRAGRPRRADVKHDPWTLHDAETEIEVETLTTSLGIARPTSSPILHYASSLDVVARWPGAATR